MLPNSLIIGSTKIKLDAIASTNDFIRDLLTKEEEVIEGTVVIAENQHGDRGQRGNNWISEPGKNLTFSFVLYPKFLAPSDQFDLSKAISMAIVKYLQEVLPVNMSAVRVKWPNDIYVGEKKICGILIENAVSGSNIQHSVVGIGLNVNQEQFDADLPNPTSMKMITGDSREVDEILNELCGYLDAAYIDGKHNQFRNVNSIYEECLYLYGETKGYIMNGEAMKASIQGVDEAGKLILKMESGEIVHADFKEVSYC